MFPIFCFWYICMAVVRKRLELSTLSDGMQSDRLSKEFPRDEADRRVWSYSCPLCREPCVV